MSISPLNDIDPKKDYIPIWFMAGTGGKFLCYWLTNAKLQYTKLILKDSGSSGLCENELPIIDFERPKSLNDHIEFFKSCSPRITTFSPYFYTTTITHPRALKKWVEKLIYVSYDIDDIDWIFKFYVAKNSIQIENNNNRLYEIYERFNITYNQIIKTVFCTDNMLEVTFKELFFKDTVNLIKKLSDFTKIKERNFDTLTFAKWRQLSFNSAELVENKLNKFYEQYKFAGQNSL